MFESDIGSCKQVGTKARNFVAEHNFAVVWTCQEFHDEQQHPRCNRNLLWFVWVQTCLVVNGILGAPCSSSNWTNYLVLRWPALRYNKEHCVWVNLFRRILMNSPLLVEHMIAQMWLKAGILRNSQMCSMAIHMKMWSADWWGISEMLLQMLAALKINIVLINRPFFFILPVVYLFIINYFILDFLLLKDFSLKICSE